MRQKIGRLLQPVRFNAQTYLDANADVAAAITLVHSLRLWIITYSLACESRPCSCYLQHSDGGYFTLTTGVDSLTGTANDDTFNALTSNNAAGQTFTTGDNGGAGTDNPATIGAASTYVANV